MFVNFFDWIYLLCVQLVIRGLGITIKKILERECVGALSYPFQSILIISHPILNFNEEREKKMPSQRVRRRLITHQLINNKLQRKIQTSINNFVWHLFLIRMLFSYFVKFVLTSLSRYRAAAMSLLFTLLSSTLFWRCCRFYRHRRVDGFGQASKIGSHLPAERTVSENGEILCHFRKLNAGLRETSWETASIFAHYRNFHSHRSVTVACMLRWNILSFRSNDLSLRHYFGFMQLCVMHLPA